MSRAILIHRPAIAVALLACLGVTAAAADPELPPLHRLAGVVVSKNGQPLAGVEVAMTHAEHGNLVFVGGGRLRAFGQDETVLLFFPKRNGRVKVEGKTDASGRFTLEGFTSPGSPYNVGAVHPQHGAALLTNVVPQDYAARELRIELDEPSFVRTEIPGFDSAFTETGWDYVRLELAPAPPPADSGRPPAATAPAAAGAPSSAPGGAAGPAAVEADEPQVAQVMFDLKREPGGSESEPGTACWGPLPAGRRYAVSRVRYSRGLASTSTLFARTVSLAAGQTATVELKADGNIAVSGRVTGLDDQPLAGVNLTLHVADELTIGAVSDHDGAYELRNVPSGQHTLKLFRRAPRSGFG